MRRTLIYVVLGVVLLLNGRGIPLEKDIGVKDIGRNLSPAWVPEGFLSVSPTAEQQTILWGRLKQTDN